MAISLAEQDQYCLPHRLAATQCQGHKEGLRLAQLVLSTINNCFHNMSFHLL